MIKYLIIISLALTFSSCATSPVPTLLAKQVPQTRIYTQEWSDYRPKTGRLIIKRDSGMVGLIANIGILIDGTLVTDLATSEKIELFLPIGEHVISAEAWGMTVAIDVVISEGGKKVMRTGYNLSGDLHLQRAAY